MIENLIFLLLFSLMIFVLNYLNIESKSKKINRVKKGYQDRIRSALDSKDAEIK